MEKEYKVIKLVNGTLLVGNMIFTPEDVLIQYPLEVCCKPVMDGNGKVVGEHMVLRPFLIMTTEKEVSIDTYNVLYVNKLDKRLFHSYEEMSNTVYEKPVSFEGNFFKEEAVPEMTKEDAEYMKEVLSQLTDIKDDTVH